MNWSLLRLLAISSDVLTRTFFAFYLWENMHDLKIILVFGLISFGIIPIASLVAGYVTDEFDIKIPMLFGIWIQVLQILLIIYADFPISMGMLALIALLGGIGEATRDISVHAIEFGVQEQGNIAHYYADRSFLSKLIELILPISAAYLVTVTEGNYDFLFQLIVGLLVIKTLFVFFYKIPGYHNKFKLKNILAFPGTNKDKFTLVKGVFLEGLSEGITMTILPVIVLIFADSILKWGFVNTGIVLFGALVSLFLTQWITDINSKVLYAIGAFAFAAASTFFLAEINFIVIIVFLIANELMQVIKDVSYNSSVERIMEEDRREYNLFSEYQFLTNSVGAIGRVIPIILLLAIGLNLEDDLTLRLTLLVIGILPIIALSVLGNSRIFKDEPRAATISSIRDTNEAPALGRRNYEADNPTLN